MARNVTRFGLNALFLARPKRRKIRAAIVYDRQTVVEMFHRIVNLLCFYMP